MNMNKKHAIAGMVIMAGLLQGCGGGSDEATSPVAKTAPAVASAKVMDDNVTPGDRNPVSPPPVTGDATGPNGANDFGYLRRGLTVSLSDPGPYGQFINIDVASNAATGDTPVDAVLPVLCYDAYGFQPTPFSSPAFGEYPQWTEIRATPPIAGYLLTSLASRELGGLGNTLCANAHGIGWNMANQYLVGNFHTLFGNGQRGNLTTNTRYWLANTGAAANAWNAPGDLPIGSSDGWEYCAKQGSFCALPESKTVHFGMHNKFVSKVFSPARGESPVYCDAQTFGSDPAPNEVKGCWTSEATPPTLSSQCTASLGALTCRVSVLYDDIQNYNFRWFGTSSLDGQTARQASGSCTRGTTVFVGVQGTNRVTGHLASSMQSVYCP
jgi:hypothetical protein